MVKTVKLLITICGWSMGMADGDMRSKLMHWPLSMCSQRGLVLNAFSALEPSPYFKPRAGHSSFVVQLSNQQTIFCVQRFFVSLLDEMVEKREKENSLFCSAYRFSNEHQPQNGLRAAKHALQLSSAGQWWMETLEIWVCAGNYWNDNKIDYNQFYKQIKLMSL